jgi:multidrug efflux pump subunit AcrB
LWPGATAHEVELQVSERIEKRLQEVPWVDVVRSQTRPGESLIFVVLKDYTPKKEVPESLVPGTQEDWRHAAHAAARRPRPFPERRIR